MIPVLLLLSSILAEEPPVAKNHEFGPLRVRVETPRRVGLSEKLVLSVTISAPENVSVGPPPVKAGATHGELPVLAVKVQGPDKVGGKFATLMVQNWSIELEPLRVGRVEPAPLKLSWREGREPQATEDLHLPTVEVLAGPTSSADPSTLRELNTPTKVESVARALPRLLVYSGIGLLAGVLLLWFSMRSPRRVGAVEKAAGRISDLESALSRRPRATIDEACTVLRDYVSSAYGLPAESQTTREFLAAAETRSTVGGGQVAALAEFLDSADLERFPEGEPDASAADRCLRRARAFLAGEPKR